MKKSEAKMGVVVVDDFGAIGRLGGHVHGRPNHRFVYWEGEDRTQPAIVHLRRIRIAEADDQVNI